MQLHTADAQRVLLVLIWAGDGAVQRHRDAESQLAHLRSIRWRNPAVRDCRSTPDLSNQVLGLAVLLLSIPSWPERSPRLASPGATKQKRVTVAGRRVSLDHRRPRSGRLLLGESASQLCPDNPGSGGSQSRRSGRSGLRARTAPYVATATRRRSSRPWLWEVRHPAFGRAAECLLGLPATEGRPARHPREGRQKQDRPAWSIVSRAVVAGGGIHRVMCKPPS